MNLLEQIQNEVVSKDCEMGPLLLKVKLLASKIESNDLENWVEYESNGYPDVVEVPGYRRVHISYTGNFYGPFGKGVENASIPSQLIAQFAGKDFLYHDIREGVAGIDGLMVLGKSGTVGIDGSSLILKLQGKVYPEYNCNHVSGRFTSSKLKEIQQNVKSKVLELTLKIEKQFPDIELKEIKVESEKVQNIVHQIITGKVGTVVTGDNNGNIQSSMNIANEFELVKHLIEKGIDEKSANEFSEILKEEQPKDLNHSLGEKAEKWIVENSKKALDGTWKIAATAAVELLKEAAKSFYTS